MALRRPGLWCRRWSYVCSVCSSATPDSMACTRADRTSDIRAVLEYNGQRICRIVKCLSETEMWRYREQLRTWATSRRGE